MIKTIDFKEQIAQYLSQEDAPSVKDAMDNGRISKKGIGAVSVITYEGTLTVDADFKQDPYVNGALSVSLANNRHNNSSIKRTILRAIKDAKQHERRRGNGNLRRIIYFKPSAVVRRRLVCSDGVGNYVVKQDRKSVV